MSDLPRVLVSILNYNSYENAVETVECYLRQDYSPFHLQLIDNASTNDCLSRLQRRFPDLDFIVSPTNLGYVGGNNLALEIALRSGFDYVIVSNEDVAIGKDLISNLVKTAGGFPAVGVVGGIEENYYTGEVKAVGGSGFNFWLSRAHWSTSVPRALNPALEVDYVQGACVLFSRRALEAGLRFDDNLFMYVDEIDLGLQLKRRNLKAYVDLRCRIRHKARPKPYNTLGGYLIQRNRLYVTRKYAPRYIFVFNVLYTSLIELPFKSILRCLQGHRDFAWACIVGYRDGLKGHMGKSRNFTI